MSANYNSPQADTKNGQSTTKSHKKREKEVCIEPERDFEDQLNELRNLSTYKKDLAIKVRNFQGYFKIDLWFTLEQVMRDLSNITTIVFENCKLTKEHLKVLKGQILYQQGNRFIRIIFSSNNLSDIDMDYFIFGNSQVIGKMIDNNYISIYILNNYGIFKELFIQKISDKFSKCVIVSKKDGTISFNIRGNEDQEFKNFHFFRLSCMKCIRQSIHQFSDEQDVQENKIGLKKRKTAILRQKVGQSNHIQFLKELEEEQDQESDDEDDNPEKCLETIVDILLPQDQVNPVEKIDFGYLGIKNTNLLKKLWKEITQCSSIRLAYFHHLEDYVIDSLAISLTKRKLLVQKIEFTSSKINPQALMLIMNNISAEKLVLADCSLTDDHFENMANELKSNKRLRHQLMYFDISKNVDIGQKGMKFLGEYLKTCQNLKTLLINYGEVSDNMLIQFVGDLLTINGEQQTSNLQKCLETLELKGNKDITVKGYSILMDWLCTFQQFKSINLSDNDIQNNIIDMFYTTQISFFQKLRTLNLSQNKSIDKLQWEKFMEMISESHNLQQLIIEDCELKDSKITGIFESLLNIKQNICNSLELLNISNNKFEEEQSHLVVTTFLMKCQNLHSLNLTNINLSHPNHITLAKLLDPKLQCLQNLQHLNLSSNEDMSEEGWDVLFSKLKELETLKSLDISKCQLTPRICKRIYQQLGDKCYLYKSISNFNLSHNTGIKEGWEYLAACLRNFDRINSLNLTETIYSNKDLFLIEKAFKYKPPTNKGNIPPICIDINADYYPLIKTLKKLIFAMNTSPNLEGWDSFWRSLSQFQQLEELDLSSCMLQEEKVIKLATSAKNAPFLDTLQIISLYGNSFLNLIGWLSLFDCLIYCKKLEKLDLSFCFLTNEKIMAISKMISLPDSTLKYSLRNLILNGNDKIGSIGYRKLLQTVTGRQGKKKLQLENKKNNEGSSFQDAYYEDIKDHLFSINKLPQELTKLHLDKNIRITPQELGYLFRQISMFEQIKEISLQQCYLNDKKIDTILKPLQREASRPLKLSLQSLNLSGNTKITFQGWQKLFQTLSNCVNIQKIYLSNCNLGDQQIKYIAETIKKSDHLLRNITDLDLSCNSKMSQKSLQILFSVLENSSLQYLSLSNCELDDKKFKPFLNSLKKSQMKDYLITLDLSKNPKISPLNWKIFFQSLNSMDSIAHLNLEHCCLNSERLTFLQQELNRSNSNINDKIRTLHLLGSYKVKDSIWEQLFQSFKNCIILEDIGLEFCNLNQKNCEVMFREFTSEQSCMISSIKKLNLSGNYTINKEGWEFIFRLVSNLKNLQFLSLSLCELDDDKVSSILQCIKKDHPVTYSISKISFNYNQKITQIGWNQIFSSIANFKKLDNLMLIKCGINDEIISTMMQCFKQTTLVGKSLKRLNISNNPNIQKAGYISLIQFLKNDCKSIQSVKIDDNGIDEQNLEEIVVQMTGKSVKTQKKKKLQQISDQLKRLKKDQKIQDIVQGLIQNIQSQKVGTKQISIMKKFTIQMTLKDTQFQVIQDLPKSLSKAVYKLNKYFLESKNLRIEKNVLSNGIIYNLGNFPPDMIGDHFIKYIVEDKNILCFSTKGLRQLSRIFAYNLPPNEIEPYPYRIILNQYNLKYLTNHIKEIYILNNSYDSEVEQLTYPFLKEIFNHFHKTGINQIHLDYVLSNSFYSNIMKEGGEKYLTEFIQLLPPKRIEFQQSATLPCWKAIYSMVYNSYNIQSVNMSYDINSVSNVGIAFAWREHIYYNYKPTTLLGRCLKFLIYYFLSIFVKDSVKYKYTKDIQELNDKLSIKKCVLILMFVLTCLYYTVAIGAPIVVSYYDIDYTATDGTYDKNKVCDQGVGTIALIIYLSFAIISALVEIYLFIYVYKKAGHLLPNPMDMKDYDKNRVYTKTEKAVYYVKSLFQNKKEIFFIIALIQSQISKYDLYNDVGFTIVCFACDYAVLGYLNAIIIISNILVSLFNLLSIFRRIAHKTPRLYSSISLNQFYEVSTLLECAALSDVLDFLAPFNVWIIPNNIFTKYFLPRLAGKSISSKIFKSCIKFLFEDTPQLILSLLFIIMNTGSSINQNAIIAIITSSLSLGVSTYNFLSIRPSTISQLDFNELTNQKSVTYQNKALDILAMERKQIFEWRNHYLENKCISMDVIPQETGELISIPQHSHKESDFKFIVQKNK